MAGHGARTEFPCASPASSARARAEQIPGLTTSTSLLVFIGSVSSRKKSWHVNEDGTPYVYWSEIPDLDAEPIAEESSLGYVPELILALEVLTPKQRFVIERRYGLIDGTVYSHRQIAEAMGVYHRAVQKLEIAGLERMRKWVAKNPLWGEAHPSGHA